MQIQHRIISHPHLFLFFTFIRPRETRIPKSAIRIPQSPIKNQIPFLLHDHSESLPTLTGLHVQLVNPFGQLQLLKSRGIKARLERHGCFPNQLPTHIEQGESHLIRIAGIFQFYPEIA